MSLVLLCCPNQAATFLLASFLSLPNDNTIISLVLTAIHALPDNLVTVHCIALLFPGNCYLTLTNSLTCKALESVAVFAISARQHYDSLFGVKTSLKKINRLRFPPMGENRNGCFLDFEGHWRMRDFHFFKLWNTRNPIPCNLSSIKNTN